MHVPNRAFRGFLQPNYSHSGLGMHWYQWHVHAHPCTLAKNLLEPSHSTAMGMSASAPYSSTRSALNIVKPLSHVEPKTERVLQHLRGYPPAPRSEAYGSGHFGLPMRDSRLCYGGFISFFMISLICGSKHALRKGPNPCRASSSCMRGMSIH